MIFLFVVTAIVCGQVTVNNQFSVKLDISDPIPSERFAEKELKQLKNGRALSALK